MKNNKKHAMAGTTHFLNPIPSVLGLLFLAPVLIVALFSVSNFANVGGINDYVRLDLASVSG